MTETCPHKTIQPTDTKGKPYAVEPEQLLRVARQCIRERFFMAAGIASPDEAKAHFQVLLGHYEHEVFCALWLNARHRIIRHDELFRGTIDSAIVHPREVVKTALACNAASVIFAHNHPSGFTQPSQADVEITRRLKQALELIDVKVLDHVVVGWDVSSMAELGLI